MIKGWSELNSLNDKCSLNTTKVHDFMKEEKLNQYDYYMRRQTKEKGDIRIYQMEICNKLDVIDHLSVKIIPYDEHTDKYINNHLQFLSKIAVDWKEVSEHFLESYGWILVENVPEYWIESLDIIEIHKEKYKKIPKHYIMIFMEYYYGFYSEKNNFLYRGPIIIKVLEFIKFLQSRYGKDIYFDFDLSKICKFGKIISIENVIFDNHPYKTYDKNKNIFVFIKSLSTYESCETAIECIKEEMNLNTF